MATVLGSVEIPRRPATTRRIRRLAVGAVLLAGALAVPATSATAASNTALQFNGSNQYVTFGAAPALDAATFTIETWFDRTGAGKGTTTGYNGLASSVPLVTKGRAETDGSNVDINYFLGIDATSGTLDADFEEGATGAHPGRNHPISGTTVVSNNVWHHAAATYDGSTWRLYLDGNLDAQLFVGQPPRSDSIDPAALASALNSTGNPAGYFAGVLDEARIWNVARSQADIQAGMSQEITSGTGLIGRWGMDDGTGPTVTNSVPNSPNGTTVNNPTWVGGAPITTTQGGDTTPPAAPTGLTASPTATTINLSWAANTETDLAGYDVYRATTSPVPTTGTPLNGTSLVTTPSYTDTTAAPGTTYHYVVTAVDTSGNQSGPSNEVTAATTASTTDPVLVGAGDIANCSVTGDQQTAAVVQATSGGVFTLGDNAYPHGTATDFATCYDPTWGQFNARTRPAPGNHDYDTTGATGYYGYFGAAAGDPTKGYYSYDLGSYWHVIVLNAECSYVGGCGAGSPQEQWLRSDLASHSTQNVVAMWHQPRWSSSTIGSNTKYTAFWNDLYDYGADLVLCGHAHQYERFAPMDTNGQLDTTYGMREFVVGTGGDPLSGWGTILPTSEVRNNNTWGVLKLTLHATSYSWQFLPVAGKTFTDSGTTATHSAP